MSRLRFFSIAAALAVVGLFASNLNASQTAGWGVVVASNAFVAHGEGTPMPVAMGASIVQGDRLSTKSGGALVLSRGEDLVTMAENSEIVITDPQPLNATLIQQPAGNVQYHVTHGPAPHFEVDTPLLATVVKGTTFHVSTGTGGSSVTVSEGRVVAKDRRSGNSSSVGAGETGSVDTGHGGVSVHAAASAGTTEDTSISSSPSSDETATTGSDNSGKGNSGGSNGGNGNSGNGSGNSGSDNSGSGNSGSGNSGSGNSGDGNSGSGDSGSGDGDNGNGHGHGHGNKNGHHDGKGKNG